MGLALVGGVADIFMLINAATIARIVLHCFMKNTINVTIRRMSHRKAAYEQITDMDYYVSAYFKY